MNLKSAQSLLNIELLHIWSSMIAAIDLCNETVTLHKDNPEAQSLITLMNDTKANLEVALTKLNCTFSKIPVDCEAELL
jgi:hypothetical protein